MYTLIGSPKTRAFRVLWMLEELDVDFQHVNAAPRSPEILKVNPSGKVPALIVNGVTITDSAAILTYLADRHGKFTYPAGSLDRARQDAVTHCILDELDGTLWTAARHSFVLPEDRRVPAVKDSLKWEFAQSVERISDRLGDNRFIMDDELTVPDFLLTECLNWASSAKFPMEQENLAVYVARMRERPAYRRALGEAPA